MKDSWRILIVDDDIDLAASLQNMLFLEDYEARTAQDFDSALEASQAFEPHIALIDIRLGTGSGIDLLSRLKIDKPQLYCIMMTGYASEETAIAALQEGAYNYLRKPFKTEELMVTLARCRDRIYLEIEKTRAEEELRKRNEDYRKLNQDLEKMVEQRTKELEKLHRDLVRQAHKAGMAEISTAILHNVGNILTSVITSCQFIQSHLGTSSKKQALNRGMVKLLELVDAQTGEMEARAQALPEFFTRFGKLMDKEHKELNHHARRIEANVDLIRKVVLSQQRYASAGFQSESSDLKELVEDAITIQNTTLNDAKINIDTNFYPVPKINVQKYKLLHSLVNILKNAWESMKGKGLISISIYQDGQWAFIKIKDSGCGIDSDNLCKIFRYGFTTKENGNGFGLHSSANALTEMGGALWAESDGMNQGSTFIMKLPLKGSSGNSEFQQ